MTVISDLKRLSSASVDSQFKSIVNAYARELGKSNNSKGNPGSSAEASRRVKKIRRKSSQLTPSQTLSAMRMAIWKRGWAQGVLKDAQGRMCLRGAIVELYQSGHVTNDDAQIACDYLQKEVIRRGGGGDKYNFVYWNNDPRRTLADVLKVLEDSSNRARLAGE